MTQHIRAPQAFAAVSAPVANAASPPATDIRNLMARARSKVTLGRGTTQVGTMRTNTPTSTGVATRSLLIPDDVFAALSLAGVDFSDMLYNSSVAEPGSAYTAISEVVTMSQNYGHCRQVIFNFGDSLEDGPTGSGVHRDLANIANQPWQFGCDTPGLPFRYALPVTALAPNVVFNIRTHERARIIYKFANGGWRWANQAGGTYAQGSPWIDNMEQAAKAPIWPWQQVVGYFEPGSNDFDYFPGLFAVPAGTPGYVSAGSPNYVDDCLIPAIADFRARYPGAKVFWQSPTVRDSTSAPGSDNARFAETTAHILANRAALGIDLALDTRQIPQLDCRNPSVTLDPIYWQNDKTHRTKEGYALIRSYKRAGYDFLLGFAIPAPLAGAFVY